MKTLKFFAAAIFLLGAGAQAQSQGGTLPPLATDRQIAAAEAAPLGQDAIAGRWNDPFPPFRIIGNLYYVGTADIASLLIVTKDGDFLIDGGVPQTPPQIIANIKSLGFDIRDVKYLLNSHAHADHAGGLAALQRASGAVMVASAADRPILEAGHISYGPSKDWLFPPIRVDRVIGDGESLSLGGATLTAHLTPGHTPGCTSWSTNVTGSDGVKRSVFFDCSETVAGQKLVPESYPGMIGAYRATFAKVSAIHADVFLGPHAEFYDLQKKRERQLAGDANAFVDPGELQRFNDGMKRDFEAELAKEQAAAAVMH